MKNRKNLKPKNLKRQKKRIIVTGEQKQTIKKRMSQGFNSKMIAEEIDLPVSVVKRYYEAVYFKVRGRTTCSNCGSKIKKQTTCSSCKKKASLIHDDGFYSATETKPSEAKMIK